MLICLNAGTPTLPRLTRLLLRPWGEVAMATDSSTYGERERGGGREAERGWMEGCTVGAGHGGGAGGRRPSSFRLFHASLCVPSVNHPAASESPAACELLSVQVPRQAPSWLYSTVGGGCGRWGVRGGGEAFSNPGFQIAKKEGKKKKQTYADAGQLKFFFFVCFFLKPLVRRVQVFATGDSS